MRDVHHGYTNRLSIPHSAKLCPNIDRRAFAGFRSAYFDCRPNAALKHFKDSNWNEPCPVRIHVIVTVAPLRADVLRPGTFFTCAAFANTNANSPSSKMCHTGFQ
jgi:hypothetical protein